MIRSILKSLLKPDAYPELTTKVDLVQTHASWIFLTDSHAYKIKKPVDFGFLNFTTIDRRRFYCNEEVKYNNRLCPKGIYEGVVELRQTAGGASFLGDGQILDYAVKMKRLPAERMLDRLIVNNNVSVSEIRDVARVIAKFHLSTPTSPSVSEFGRLDRILFNWNENFEQTNTFENTSLPGSEREYIKIWVSLFAEQNAEIFERRIKNGFIRECDGDIHLENICLVDGIPYIFDCIEFNERFRCCDTAADIAFLLMDLDFHCRRDLSGEALAAYHDTTGDDEMLVLLDFYKIYRAFVRGKIESFHSNDMGIDQQGRIAATQKAIRYFRLARGYIERRKLQPTLFITCGLMGCGKSTLAGQLSFELGIACYNSDIVRKQLAGISPLTSSPAAFGEGLYTEQFTTDTYTELLRLAEMEIEVQGSVIIDACCIKKQDRLKFATLAARYAAQFVILHVSCSEAINRRRLSARLASDRTVSDGRTELLNIQRLEFEQPETEEGLVISIRTVSSPSALTSIIYERLC
ncbi:MAG: AAA family ATPase [Desulfuromonadales bacterium]|nr:AAA family ATPase [Desulfuromonadales bacterium]